MSACIQTDTGAAEGCTKKIFQEKEFGMYVSKYLNLNLNM